MFAFWKLWKYLKTHIFHPIQKEHLPQMSWQTFKVCKVYFEFFDVLIYKLTINMVDFILHRNLGLAFPRLCCSWWVSPDCCYLYYWWIDYVSSQKRHSFSTYFPLIFTNYLVYNHFTFIDNNDVQDVTECFFMTY